MAPADSAGDGLPRAVALAYGDADAAAGLAPRVVATGQGAIAETIIARAREAGVPIHESRELVAALLDFDLDQRIPPVLYLAVAEVLAWVHRLEHEFGPPAAVSRARPEADA